MEIKDKIIYPLLASVSFFVLYIFFSPPTIVFGDSPELILASYSLGISHPPGYPLYSILTKAFHFLLPFISYAKACNIFSAFIASVSIFIFFMTLQKLNISILISSLTTIVLGLTEIFFKQSLIAEVYSLNNLFFVIALYLLLSYRERKDVRLIFLSFFIIGIGLANHHTLLSILFVFSIYFFLIEKRLTALIPSIFFFAIGLSTYLYLPIRSQANPLLDWGNPETFQAFLEVILRKQFGLGSKIYTFDGLLNQLSDYAIFLNDQLFILLIALMFVGLYLIFKEEKKIAIPLLMIFLINGVLTPIALNSTSEDFFLVKEFLTPSLIVSLIFVSYGAKNFFNKGWLNLFYVLIFLFSITYKFYYDFERIDKRKDIYAYKLAKDSLISLPEGSFIIGESDYTLFPLWYLQNVEGLRKDITILDADFLMLPWYQSQNIKRLPILKELIPDISAHTKSRKGSVLDEAVLEGFKLDQSTLLAKNISEKLGKEVFFTFDFYAMAKAYKPELIKLLTPFSVVYHLNLKNSLVFDYNKLDVTPLLGKINIPKEEIIFLTPYVPYLIEKANTAYKNFDFSSAINLLNNAFLIEPSPERALYLAFALADGKRELDRAERLVLYAERNSLVSLPKINLVKGLILLRRNNLKEAFAFLSKEEITNPNSCEVKIYLYELFTKGRDGKRANEYYSYIMSNCDDYAKNRVKSINSNP